MLPQPPRGPAVQNIAEPRESQHDEPQATLPMSQRERRRERNAAERQQVRCLAERRQGGSRHAKASAVQAVILAGGLATRMRPRTLTTPKFLLEVAGKSFADWLLERLAACGFDNVVLCIGHMGEAIRDYVGDGSTYGLSVRYSDEGKILLGTAGALRRAIDSLEPSFLVTYGDSFLPFDYGAPLRELRASADADGVMAVYKNEGRWDTSNTTVRRDDDGHLWVARYEKRRPESAKAEDAPDHIDYGAMALRREVVATLALGEVVGLDVIQTQLANQGRLRAHLAGERFYEIGSEAGLAELALKLSTKEPT